MITEKCILAVPKSFEPHPELFYLVQQTDRIKNGVRIVSFAESLEGIMAWHDQPERWMDPQFCQENILSFGNEAAAVLFVGLVKESLDIEYHIFPGRIVQILKSGTIDFHDAINQYKMEMAALKTPAANA